MILIIDNYDSFTYNLVQLAGSIVSDIRVVRNDELSVEEVKALSPSHIIISSGPGHPADAGVSAEVVDSMKGEAKILGICLGHLGICECFGAQITAAKYLMHGKRSDIHIANGSPIFCGLAPVIQAAMYHSLIVKKETLPDDLLVIAEDNGGEVMAVQHRIYDIYGLQFHPDSFLSTQGEVIIKNFFRKCVK